MRAGFLDWDWSCNYWLWVSSLMSPCFIYLKLYHSIHTLEIVSPSSPPPLWLETFPNSHTTAPHSQSKNSHSPKKSPSSLDTARDYFPTQTPVLHTAWILFRPANFALLYANSVTRAREDTIFSAFPTWREFRRWWSPYRRWLGETSTRRFGRGSSWDGCRGEGEL